MKISTHDIAAILQQFHLSDEKPAIHTIDQTRITHPAPNVTIASFRFKRQLFYLIIDVTAEDNTSYLLRYIHDEKPETEGEFLTLPAQDLATYALPYKGKEAYLFAVRSPKKRLDLYLSEKYPETSRSTWQKHIKSGYISVNGEVVTSSKQEIPTSAAVAIAIPEAQDYTSHTLPIVFLDDNVIVVNKPTGVLTHAKGVLSEEFTVADFFRRYTTFGLDTNRPGIIHRLDRDTSGIIIGARNPETARLFQKQFAERQAKKTYLAVIDGILKEREAHIDLPIGRNPSAPSTFRVDPKGKSAITQYRVIAEKDKESLVELKPLTGRTHQLRVHMNYLHVPIHGDTVYGKAADRLYLHAHQLEVTIPDGQRKVFIAPIPPEFKQHFSDAL
jgi:23S rRNA pseudouridine1911/1915/1917 synthase